MGKLYICGTPIGNLEDASIRLLKTLRSVDMIACEDTRHTLKLLNRYKIKNKLISYHQYSNEQKADYILQEIMNGRDVALVSDAGMPTISDPGETLVAKALQVGIEVDVIPGPSACTTALAISGVDSSAFVFEGFLPNKKGRRVEKLEILRSEKRTVILYEAPHRLINLLEDIIAVMGEERAVVVVRELTKKYQDVQRGSAVDLLTYYQQNPPRGEICLLIPEGKEEVRELSMEDIAVEINEMLEAGVDKKEAFKQKARQHNVKKSDIYRYFLDHE